MNEKIRLKLVVSMLIVVGLFFPVLCSAADGWEKIWAEPGPIEIEFNGESREIYPSCALPLPGDESQGAYAFYFKPGKIDKLVIFFNGGGACWNAETCLQSLETPLPAYVPSIAVQHNDAANWGGILDLNNDENPYRDWSMLFLPYCTGDIHIGSNDKYYAPPEVFPYPVRHRGFDNFLYARDWLRKRYRHQIDKVGKILVAGSSAGAYGAAFNYPYIKQIFPGAKGFLLADAGNGVFAEGFSTAAIHGDDASWQVDANIPNWIPGINLLPNYDPDNYIVGLYSSLISYYPKDKFASYTTAWDAVQVMFYNLMSHPQEPWLWSDGASLSAAYQIWPLMMRTFAYSLDTFDNYSYYIATGCEHSVLRDDKFYSEDIDGVSFLNWMQGLTGGNPYHEYWRSLICTDCLPPSSDEIAACLSGQL